MSLQIVELRELNCEHGWRHLGRRPDAQHDARSLMWCTLLTSPLLSARRPAGSPRVVGMNPDGITLDIGQACHSRPLEAASFDIGQVPTQMPVEMPTLRYPAVITLEVEHVAIGHALGKMSVHLSAWS